MPPVSRLSRQDAEQIAIEVLGFLAADPERLGRFLAITGLGPDTLRSAAAQPGFLAQVMAYLGQDESALLAYAANAGRSPADVAAADAELNGGRDGM